MKTIALTLKILTIYSWVFLVYFIFMFILRPGDQKFVDELLMMLVFGIFVIAPGWFVLSIISWIKESNKKMVLIWNILFVLPPTIVWIILLLDNGRFMDFLLD